jgi:hypothetical protein
VRVSSTSWGRKPRASEDAIATVSKAAQASLEWAKEHADIVSLVVGVGVGVACQAIVTGATFGVG